MAQTALSDPRLKTVLEDSLDGASDVRKFLIQHWKRLARAREQFESMLLKQERKLEEIRQAATKCLGAQEAVESMLLEHCFGSVSQEGDQ